MARESGLIQRVRARLQHLHGDDAPQLLLGVSGGPDSVALALVFADLARLGLARATVCHVDHGVRPGSDADAVFVQKLADQLGLPCIVRRISPEAIAQHQGTGLEEAMRRERYRIFASLCGELECEGVVLGHHQDDQAETVLLHLFHGSGLRGVGGMDAQTRYLVPWWDGSSDPKRITIWRPFLDESRSSLQAFLEERSQTFLTDPSNEEIRFRRNAVRHRVLPVIEEEFPGATGTIASFAEIARADDAFLTELSFSWLEAHTTATTLDRQALRDAHQALQRRVVRGWLVGQTGLAELGAERTEAVRLAATASSSGQIIQLGDGWSVAVHRDTLELARAIES